MPIWVSPASRHELRQGDLLREVILHVTSETGEPQPLACEFALVVSRDCDALRRQTIMVAPVRATTLQGIGKTGDQLRKGLKDLRDGVHKPNSFYLGTIDGHPDRRFVAALDEVCSIRLPKDRAEWVRQKLCWALQDDFRVALRHRLADVTNRPGFDDYDWYCTEDLDLLIGLADAEEKAIEARIATAQAALATARASAPVAALTDGSEPKQPDSKTLETARTDLENHRKGADPLRRARKSR